jgi:hypothetical protein
MKVFEEDLHANIYIQYQSTWMKYHLIMKVVSFKGCLYFLNDLLKLYNPMMTLQHMTSRILKIY